MRGCPREMRAGVFALHLSHPEVSAGGAAAGARVPAARLKAGSASGRGATRRGGGRCARTELASVAGRRAARTRSISTRLERGHVARRVHARAASTRDCVSGVCGRCERC